MRRGQVRPEPLRPGTVIYSKRELLVASGLSAKTFDTIRKAARVKGPGHGGLDWVFSVDDVKMLIHRAASGSFTERGGVAATAWRAMLEEAGVRVD